MDNQLEKLQRQYFDFCTELIKKIPPEVANQDFLLMKAFGFRDELEKEIIRSEMTSKSEYLKTVEKEIENLRIELTKDK